ncbi:MAG: class I SAM-dependent methyltransferase [Bacteroidota bacterium]
MESIKRSIHAGELTEKSFESFLPPYLRSASRLYFTPIEVAKRAAEWLTETQASRILDIGAGVGKFCTSGACFSNAHFYGIEHRESLCKIGNQIAKHFDLENVTIQHANILDIQFLDYEAFYIYNPFYENLEFVKRLNDEVALEADLYSVYLNHTETQLDLAKKGTRLVTYYGNNFEVPNSYEKVREDYNGELKLWIKQC